MGFSSLLGRMSVLAIAAVSSTALAQGADDVPEWMEALELPNYSYAGYALVPESIEPKDLPVVHVGDHGAKPNDRKSDKAAIAAAIRAGEEKGGAIIQFEAGEYWVGEKKQEKQGFFITSPNIVIRGAEPTASAPKGTVLYMRHSLAPADPKKMYSCPPLLKFQHPTKGKKLTSIVSDSEKGGFEISVKDPGKLKVGQYVTLYMRNPAATSTLLAGLEPWSIWTNTIENGPIVHGERHRIVAIDGSTVTFHEPMMIDVFAEHGWEVRSCPMAEGWVVEDITFVGEVPTPWVHHKNADHDSGWTMIGFNRGFAPVIRRCKFVSVSTGAFINGSYGGTAIDNVVLGRRGHYSISSGGGSYGTLIAFNKDLTKEGQWHGFGSSHGAVGTVIYRNVNSKRGFDHHSGTAIAYATLIDVNTGGIFGSGGNYKNLPNHLHDLTFWNFKQTHDKRYDNYDWWSARRGDQKYSGTKVVYPRIVGYHGIRTTFKPESCSHIHCHGKPVEPESLFEYQVLQRLGELPEWMASPESRAR
ncbi:DUF4955 domain-containing protein [Algisphaera agarilytica]|uniref:DUF4955 domain-containing protein n=1 Tax=Algisphaera agarilytica TaxID=1385975 RepID=A0A7X0H4M7_9BACT|nr:DUF4955 domain-containing protein [Algisphaera agarilytica]MBB6429169.1 hypothetical protein [Algisphaera agarilytica]